MYVLCLPAEESALQTVLAETAILVKTGTKFDKNWFMSR